jgi:hypothetical protein
MNGCKSNARARRRAAALRAIRDERAVADEFPYSGGRQASGFTDAVRW